MSCLLSFRANSVASLACYFAKALGLNYRVVIQRTESHKKKECKKIHFSWKATRKEKLFELDNQPETGNSSQYLFMYYQHLHI